MHREPRLGWIAYLLLGLAVVPAGYTLLWAFHEDHILLRSPREIASASVQLVSSGELWPPLRGTLGRWGGVVLLSSLVGLTLGVLLRSQRWAWALFRPTIDYLRSTPAVTYSAFLMLLMPIAFVSSAVASIACTLVMIVYTALALERALQNEVRILTARALGARGVRLFFRVIFMDALPQTMDGVQVVISLALVYVIAIEALLGGVDAGLGAFIFDLKGVLRLSEMYALVFLTGVLGFLANLLFSGLRQSVIHPWAEQGPERQ